MKRMGLIGGMSWESTLEYYRLVNEEVHRRLGGLHSAPLVLFSVDFAEIERLQSRGRWSESGRLLADLAARLEGAGADFLLLCTNTMHRVAPQIERAIKVPLLHIGDVTAAAIRTRGLSRIALLGTRFTMEQDFYRSRLRAHGLQVLVPAAGDRQAVDRIIYRELCVGQIREASRDRLVRIIARLQRRGAQGVILGCTELPLLVRPGDCGIPVFDTTRLHALAAVERALAG